MTIYQYDPTDWLVSLTRGLEDYAKSKLNGGIFQVQMSFPDPGFDHPAASARQVPHSL